MEREDSPCRENREDSSCREMGSEDSTMQGDHEEILTIPTGWYALLQCSLLFLSFFLPLKVAPQRLCTQGWPVRCPVSSPTTLPEPLSAVATRLRETMPCKMSWVFSMTSPGMEGPGATCFPSVVGVTFASVVEISKFPDLFDILVLWEKSHLDVVFSLNVWGLFRSVIHCCLLYDLMAPVHGLAFQTQILVISKRISPGCWVAWWYLMCTRPQPGSILCTTHSSNQSGLVITLFFCTISLNRSDF